MTTLIQVGVEILNAAKARLLQWYKDFIIKFFDPRSWMAIGTDTDSFILAFQHEDLERNVKKEMREEFRKEIHNFLVPEEQDPAYKKLRCAPELCKTQVGDGLAAVALNAKCYSVLTRTQLIQTNKGVTDKLDANQQYTSFFEKLGCLLDKNYEINNSSSNILFKYRENEMSVIQLYKRSLSRLNIKFGYCRNNTCPLPLEYLNDKDWIKNHYPYMDMDCGNNFMKAIEAVDKISNKLMKYLFYKPHKDEDIVELIHAELLNGKTLSGGDSIDNELYRH